MRSMPRFFFILLLSFFISLQLYKDTPENSPAYSLIYRLPIRQVNLSLLFISVDDIVTSRAIGDHSNRESDMFLNELNILSAVLRQILVFLDAADIAFPSRQSLQNRFCFLKQCSCRKFCCYFSINLISCADRNFIQISKNIKNCESNICSSLKTASVFGSNTVVSSAFLSLPEP